MKQSFKVGEKVVYPLQGVAEIKSIDSRQFKGKNIDYYKLYIESTDMTIMVPTDKLETCGIRAIVSNKECQKALVVISGKPGEVPSDWKERYQKNLDLLRQGSILDIAEVVTQLYHRSQTRDLPIQEKKLYESAEKILIDEFSSALNKPKEEVHQMIFCRLASEDE